MMQSHPLPPGVTVFERGWLSANNVLFADEAGATLLDSGYCTHAAQTVALVERALQGRSLDRLMNTHLHSDHCGGNAALQARFPGVSTLIPPGQAQDVRDWDPVALTYVPTGQQCPRFRVDGVLEPGTELALAGWPWQVHAAPGHDPHSVILFEPRSRVLVSADALWEHGFGVVFPELEGERGFDDVAATLDLIESLSPATVIPGHGAVFTDVPKALATARARLAAYRADPKRHAAHAAKVLLKFKLLELQSLPMAELEMWACRTPYFPMVFARYFGDGQLSLWLQSLVASLVKSGAASVEGAHVANA
jgi:glyoxylase-like metal-dependent hydrolase (beta-lactamase superfamily II)